MIGDVAVAVLLALGVGSALMGAVGILTTRNPYDQLHFTGPATVIGSFSAARYLAAAATSQTRPASTVRPSSTCERST